MKPVLVIGLGSIGLRHAKNLKELGHGVCAVSQRAHDSIECFKTLEEAVAKYAPERVIISNETSKHFEGLQSSVRLLGRNARYLVEKPLFDKLQDVQDFPASAIMVAYHLRFLPLVGRLKELLESRTIVSYYSYVGQYLPTWRPGQDYRDSYSAHKNKGGGVLRDLSHELDLAMYLLGDVAQLSASGGKITNLEIDSDDHFSIIAQTEKCKLATLALNYADHLPRRFIKVITTEDTFDCDLIGGTILGRSLNEIYAVPKDEAYQLMLREFCSGEASAEICRFSEGLRVLQLIDLAEKSNREGRRLAL